MTWLNESNRRMMIFRFIQLVAATMFYLSTVTPGTISVPCANRGRHHRRETAFVSSNCIIKCRTDLSPVKALQRACL